MSRRSRRAVAGSTTRRGGPYTRPNALFALPPAHESVRRSFAFGVPRQFAARQMRFKRDLFLSLSARPRPRAQRRRADSFGFLRHLKLQPQALICVKRKQRREVMFALGVAGGSGAMRGRRFRRTQDSQYGC